jgi:hypothetical protein
MMANVAALRKPKAAPDPLRQALHDAIAAERAAVATIEELKRASRTARENVKAAESKLPKIQEIVDAALADRAADIAAAARAGKPAPSSDGIAQARAQADTLRDEITAGERAMEQLRTDGVRAREAHAEAQRAVERCRSEIIATGHIRPLLAEVRAAVEKLGPLVALLAGVDALSAPRGHGFIDRQDEVEKAVVEIKALRDDLVALGSFAYDRAAGARWRALRSALQDPDAVLPELK